MKKHLLYGWYLAKHKFFVMWAGLKIGAPLRRLITHDLSKLLPDEWFPYANFFYGRNGASQEDLEDMQAAFDLAWLKHQHRNPHHHQHYLLREDSSDGAYYTNPNDGDINSPTVRIMGTFYGKEREEVANVRIGVGDGYQMIEDAFNLAERMVAGLNVKVMPMPRDLVLEMVADWMGAGKAITGEWEVKAWYGRNKNKMVLHEDTRCLVGEILERL